MNFRNVAILLFHDVEMLDFAGLFEVLAVASEWHEDRWLCGEAVNTRTAAYMECRVG